jgi:hypothetical protein
VARQVDLLFQVNARDVESSMPTKILCHRAYSTKNKVIPIEPLVQPSLVSDRMLSKVTSPFCAGGQGFISHCFITTRMSRILMTEHDSGAYPISTNFDTLLGMLYLLNTTMKR